MTNSLTLSLNHLIDQLTNQLTEPESIALAQSIQCQTITTPLSAEAIATTFVRQGTGGSPIVLLHGFDGSLLEFRRLLPLLAAQRETWAIDLLGFGYTERQPGLPYSAAAIKTHLYHTWATLISQPMILVGASMGGAVAIDLTLTYPNLVKQLVLIDSAGYTGGAAIGKFLIPPLGLWATKFLSNPKVRQDLSVKSYSNSSFASADALCCASSHLLQPGWQSALIAFTRSGGYGSFKRQLSQITQPTLILWGESDRILGTKDATNFQQALPNSNLIWIKNCGHVPHLEQSKITADRILNWLQ